MILPLLANLSLLQNRWKAILDPIIQIPFLNGVAISNIELTASTPLAIPTTLNRKQQGWIITDNTADCRIWRTEEFNEISLTLESNANTTISLWVY